MTTTQHPAAPATTTHGGHGPVITADPALASVPDTDLIATVQHNPPASPARDAACTELIRRYQHLVHAAARHYRNTPEPGEELLQSGYLGLLKAINNYNPDLGPDLAAYARPCISGEIKRHFRDHRWPVHVRRRAQELRAQLTHAHTELTQTHHRPPTTAELAAHLHLTPAQLQDAQHADTAFTTLSLDAPLSPGPHPTTLTDLLGGTDPAIDTHLTHTALWTHIRQLPPREQHLLTLRYYGNLTQAQIGAQLGISQMHVSRLLTHAHTYLRHHLLTDD